MIVGEAWKVSTFIRPFAPCTTSRWSLLLRWHPVLLHEHVVVLLNQRCLQRVYVCRGQVVCLPQLRLRSAIIQTRTLLMLRGGNSSTRHCDARYLRTSHIQHFLNLDILLGLDATWRPLPYWLSFLRFGLKQLLVLIIITCLRSIDLLKSSSICAQEIEPD